MATVQEDGVATDAEAVLMLTQHDAYGVFVIDADHPDGIELFDWNDNGAVTFTCTDDAGEHQWTYYVGYSPKANTNSFECRKYVWNPRAGEWVDERPNYPVSFYFAGDLHRIPAEFVESPLPDPDEAGLMIISEGEDNRYRWTMIPKDAAIAWNDGTPEMLTITDIGLNVPYYLELGGDEVLCAVSQTMVEDINSFTRTLLFIRPDVSGSSFSGLTAYKIVRRVEMSFPASLETITGSTYSVTFGASPK